MSILFEKSTGNIIEVAGEFKGINPDYMALKGIDCDESVTNVSELDNEKLHTAYRARVVELIREQYTQDDEFALLAKGNEDNTDSEYVAYRTYVEDSKQQALSDTGYTPA